MKRNLLLLLLILAAIIGGTVLLDLMRPDERLLTAPEIVDVESLAAPDFSFADLTSSQERTLSAHRGKVVLLNFWASWCAPCIVEFPKLVQLVEDQPSLIVLAVTVDDDRADVERFLARIKYRPQERFLIVHDAERRIAQDIFQTFKFPETIIIDPQGRMVRKVVGDTDWTGQEMRSYLSSLAPSPAIP